jgi:hypothetical protein
VVKQKPARDPLALRSDEDLDLSLRMITELNRTIVAADTKAGLLLTAVGFALSGLFTAVRLGGGAGWQPINLVALLVVIPVGACVGYLSATVRPTLAGSAASSWFSFPAFPALPGGRLPARPDAAVLAEQAWRQAAMLAMIARRKHRAFTLALRWGTGSVLAFLAWFSTALALSWFP